MQWTGENVLKKQIREFKVCEDLMSCTNCDYCYGQNGKSKKEYRVFCQEKGMYIDPTNDEENNERAKKCKHWIFCGYGTSEMAQGISIRSLMLPNCEQEPRWYEKDSIA